MYVANSRFRDNTSATRTYQGKIAEQFVSFGNQQHVYSFRTGKGLKGAVATSYRSFKPTGSGLAEKLAARKEYLEGIDRSLTQVGSDVAHYTQGRTNAFVRVANRTVGRLNATIDQRNGRYVHGYHYPLLGVYGVPSGANRFGLDTTFFGRQVGPQLAAVQNFGSAMHYAANPLKASVGIAETVAELLSGNFPKLSSKVVSSLSNGSLLKALKDAPKNASQDYLNTQFGIGPILSDLYALLIKGILLHDALYGSSFRRQRSSPLSTDSWSVSSGPSTGGHRMVAGHATPQLWSAAISGIPASVRHATMTTDMRFKARFTLARASSSANGNYDRALALVRQYGLWTPSLLWDLTPWSWIFDWFLNLSRGITNAYDYGKDGGLKSDYACVTSRTRLVATAPPLSWDYRDGTNRYYGHRTGYVTATDILWRVPVNPFGQYANLSSMSSWQRGILVALGLART